MTRAQIAARVHNLVGATAGVDETVAFREAKESARHRDSAAIVALTDGRFAWIHDQPATHGHGVVIASRAICETAARRSVFAARLNLHAGRANPSVMRP